MSKRFFGILIALIIGLGFVFWIAKGGDQANAPGGGQATNHVMGEGKKGVVFIEYGDYQCPVCQTYYQPVKQAVSALSNDITFQFRNLPLSSIHPNAFAAARAAEAAAKQNRFWEMHDLLYEQANWQSWTTSSNPQPTFEIYAQQLGLNVEQFKQDYASSEINSLINADLSEFKKTGQQQATPAFFIDGKFIANSELSNSNVPNVEKITAVLNAAIAAKTKQ